MKKRIIILIASIFSVAILLAVFFIAKKNIPFFSKLTDKQIVEINDKEGVNFTNIAMFSPEQNIENPLSFTTIRQPLFSERICDIVNYGAVGDGKTKNTEAFAKAIIDCSNQGGGQVLVPDGNWLTGSIHLLSNINLHLENNATITFSDRPSDYLPVVFSRYEGIEYNGFSPFIYAENAKNIAITGR